MDKESNSCRCVKIISNFFLIQSYKETTDSASRLTLEVNHLASFGTWLANSKFLHTDFVGDIMSLRPCCHLEPPDRGLASLT